MHAHSHTLIPEALFAPRLPEGAPDLAAKNGDHARDFLCAGTSA